MSDQPYGSQFSNNQPPLPPSPQQQQPQKKPMSKGVKFGLGCLGLIIVLAICGAIGSAVMHGSSNSNATAQVSTASTSGSTSRTTTTKSSSSSSTTITSGKKYAQFSDGNYKVGSDIKPGTYRTRSGSSGCYYERLKGFSGATSDIIANDNTDAPAVITIAPSDKGFTSNNCGTWTSDLSRITSSKTSFDDGTYIVGTDIAPGTYKSSGQSGCYYARLSGFGGTTEEILANNNTDTSAIITISSTDKGFVAHSCGHWSKM